MNLKFNKIAHVLFLFLFTYIFCNVITFYPRFVKKYVEEETLNLSTGLVITLAYISVVVIIVALLWGFSCLKKNQLTISRRKLDLIFVFLSLIMLATQICFALSIDYVPVTDSNVIETSARNFALTGNIENLYDNIPTRIHYYSTYPNNWGILVFVSYFYRAIYLLLGYVPKLASAVVCIVAIHASIIFIYLSAKLVFKDKIRPFFCIVTSFLTPVMYFYSVILYTDILSMPFSIIAFYLFLRAIKSSSKKGFVMFTIASSLVVALGYTIKGSIIVMVVAFVAYCFIKTNWKKTLCVGISMIVCIGGVNTCLKATIFKMGIANEESLYRYEFPVQHWVMMSLYGKGGFYLKDYEYTKSWDNYDKKKSANEERIKERIKEYGVSGLIEHENEKISYTWTDGKFFSNHHLKDTTGGDFLNLAKDNRAFEVVVQIFHLAFLALVLLSFVHGFFERRINLLGLLRLLVFGIAIFLLIWETRSRYLINFLPFMIILSADGMNYLWGITHKKTKIFRARVKT